MTFALLPTAPLARPLTSIRRFLAREDGAVSIEAALMLPFLGFAYIAGFAYFDNYRREAVLTKATYTIADILSRDTGTVTPAKMEGLQELYEFLTFSEGQSRLRFTQIQKDASGRLVIHETVAGVPDTYATDGTLAMTPTQLDTVRSRIPRLDTGQVIVITESFTTHEPLVGVGLKAREYHRVAPTRNRINPELDFDLAAPIPPEEEPTPFDPSSMPAPTIALFDQVALLNAPGEGGMSPGYEIPDISGVTPTSTGFLTSGPIDPSTPPSTQGDPACSNSNFLYWWC